MAFLPIADVVDQISFGDGPKAGDSGEPRRSPKSDIGSGAAFRFDLAVCCPPAFQRHGRNSCRTQSQSLGGPPRDESYFSRHVALGRQQCTARGSARSGHSPLAGTGPHTGRCG